MNRHGSSYLCRVEFGNSDRKKTGMAEQRVRSTVKKEEEKMGVTVGEREPGGGRGHFEAAYPGCG